MNSRTVLIVKLVVIGLCVLAAVFSSKSHAASIENSFGGLTYHVFDIGGVSQRFANKISSDGRLIYTGLIGFGFTDNHDNYRLFMGQNSVGEFMYGATYSYTWEYGILKYGPIIGFYQQNDEKFLERGIKPFSLGYGIVPVVGGEFSIKILTFGDKYIRLNTVVTPAIINETIMLGSDL